MQETNPLELLRVKVNTLSLIKQSKEDSNKKNLSQSTLATASTSCNLCDDGWIQTENGFKRCICEEKRLAAIRWKKFGVNPNTVKSVKDYKPVNKQQQEAKLKAISFVKEFKHESIAFLGQAGSGKTHLSLAIGKALISKGIQGIYMPYLEAIRELKMNVLDDEIYNSLLGKYINAKVLIIDDLFKDKIRQGKLTSNLTEVDMRHIYPIINQRYINNKPIIVSSECTATMLLELDEALGGRIVEMCKDNIVKFDYGLENNFRTRFLNEKEC